VEEAGKVQGEGGFIKPSEKGVPSSNSGHAGSAEEILGKRDRREKRKRKRAALVLD